MTKYRMKFLNTNIDNVNMAEAIDTIDDFIKDGNYHYVVTPNVDHIVRLENDNEFREVYKNADLILIDGMPLVWISKWLKTPVKEKVSGSDLFPSVCELAANKGYSVFILGAAEGVAFKAGENLKKKYPGLKISGTFSPSFGFEKKPNEIKYIIDMINKIKPDILAIGVSAPKQEKFIYKYRKELRVPVSLAIGASIDIEAGNLKRAPRWMQKAGLEWFYRMFRQPKKIFKRVFIDDLKIIKVYSKYKKAN
ncbi:glycosyltransferase [Clostridium sp. CT7]|uniref:WecB/TagA/CpsF family glycosyltransferase n=2 Tax=Clostridium TaxID=1485 RepID=UPI0008244E28|nr:WecB/TagA/CpsF family glycosyltransferase [Clostridium sp. CT7]PJI09725.1 glycosyltransferase [Clostridium sp. CT7]